MSEQLGFLTCGLCGETGPSPAAIRLLLVEWTEDAAKAMARPRYQSIDRCVDRVACRSRVEQVLGVAWPVNDRTPVPVASPVATSMTDAPEKTTEEEIPWLR